MPEISHCGECGSPLPDYWPKGLCLQCALAGTLEEPIAGTEICEADPLAQPATAATGDARRFTRFGDHELLEEIGRGGMGVIYRARQISLNRTVALKMILAGQFASKQEVLRFRAEAEAAANLQHPHIVRIHETGERDGHHYFSMDYVEGKTLSELVRDGPLPAQQAAKYARTIAEAIHYAHLQGVLHRDLKPSNVIIDRNDQPRITDFGLAKRVRGDFGLTITGQVLGSPNFMPPEQTSTKSGKVGPASDVYGVGAILYHLLTGRPPFHAETIEELLLLLRDTEPVSPRLLNPSVPRDLETICLKCLEKDPARRYATAQTLADELGRFSRDEPIQARPLHATGKIWRWCRRRPAIAALSASVLLLLIAVAVSSTIAAWRVNRARTSEQRANRDLRHTVSLLELERAEDFFSAHDAASGVAQLSAILRRDPSNAVAANRLVSALVHRSWALPLGVPLAHAERVTMASFHPDGRHVLTASRDRTARVWDTDSGRAILTLHHDDQVSLAQYSPNGLRIITASADGTARIWDALTGAALFSLRHTGEVHGAEFSRDGRLVVTGCVDKLARIWDAPTGELKHELRGHTGPVLLARFSPDGEFVATGTDGGSVRIWNVDSGQMTGRLEGHRKSTRIESLAFSPDGHRLVSGGSDGTMRIFDVATGMAATDLFDFQKTVWHVAFAPDGKWILATCEDGTARLWDARTLRPVGSAMRHESGVTFGAFSSDSKRIVTASTDNTACVWDVPTGMPVCQPVRHLERVLHAGFNSDGRRVVTASHDGTAQVWELRERLERPGEIHHDRYAAPLAFSPDGVALLTTAQDRTARLWNSRTGQPLTEPIRHDAFVRCADFARDSSRLVIACNDGTVRVWNCGEWRRSPGGTTVTPQLVAGPFGHSKEIRSVCFNEIATRLLTASADGTARVWDAQTGQPITPPLTHRGAVIHAEFSRDGRFVVTASEDRTARVWDAEIGRPVTEPLVHLDHVQWAEFSPTGDRVVTASTDNTACIWDVRTSRPATPRLQHPRIVGKATFSPDGHRIATASIDRTARIWDAATGQPLTPSLRHDAPISHVYFSSDGQRVFTVTANGSTRLWDANTGRPSSEWLNPDSFWNACFDPVGERLATGGEDGVVRVWHMPRAPTPVPKWFIQFAEALAGMRFGASGNVELVDRNELGKLAKQIPSSDTTSFYGHLVLRFIGKAVDRTAASAEAH